MSEKIKTMVKCGSHVITDHIVVLPTSPNKHVLICDEAYRYIQDLEQEIFRLKLACEEGIYKDGDIVRYGAAYMALMKITSFDKGTLNYYGVTINGNNMGSHMSNLRIANEADMLLWNNHQKVTT